jgi:hypothetical protein
MAKIRGGTTPDDGTAQWPICSLRNSEQTKTRSKQAEGVSKSGQGRKWFQTVRYGEA